MTEVFSVGKKQEISPCTVLPLPLQGVALLAIRVDAVQLDKLIFKANQQVIEQSIDNMRYQIEEERDLKREAEARHRNIRAYLQQINHRNI